VFTRTVYKETQYLYENLKEFHKYHKGKPKYWREAGEGEWCISDDGQVLKILKKRTPPEKGTYVVTLLGTASLFIFLGLSLFARASGENESVIKRYALPIKLFFLIIGLFLLAQNMAVSRFIVESKNNSIDGTAYNKLTGQLDTGYYVVMIVSRVIFTLVAIGFIVWVMYQFLKMPRRRKYE